MRPPQLELDVDAAAASSLNGRVVFLLATPESGAERVLSALGAFPGVAAAPAATNVFNQGIHRILDHWRIDPGPQALSGLADVQSFLLAARLLADTPLAAFADTTGADLVVEYSPDHIMFADEIAGLYPDACLIHIVRDGRQVAARLSTPVHSWTPRGAAKRWVDDQRAMLEFEHPALYVVRIEDLLREPERLLGTLASALGLDVDADALGRAAAALGEARALPTTNHGRAGAIVDIVGPDLLLHHGYDTGSARLSQSVAAWSDMIGSGGMGFARKVSGDVSRRVAARAVRVRRALDR